MPTGQGNKSWGLQCLTNKVPKMPSRQKRLWYNKYIYFLSLAVSLNGAQHFSQNDFNIILFFPFHFTTGNKIFLIKMVKVSQCELFNEAVWRNGICGEKSSNKGEFKSKGNYIYWLWSFSNLVSLKKFQRKSFLVSIIKER